ncbi:MAG: DUF456 domain-containing protein [Thioalkalivibrionaceae bacterium]
MEWVAWSLAVALVALGLAGTLVPVLPGVPVMWLGFVWLVWLDGFERVGWFTLGILAAAMLLTVLIDLLASVLGARRVRASPEALWGALIGGVLGIFFGLIGLVLGPFVGAVIGELIARGGFDRAMDVGVASWVGLLLGTVAKFAIALMMLGGFLLAWF